MMTAKRILIIFVITVAASFVNIVYAAGATRELVLVSMSADGFTPLSAHDLRRLYLGLSESEDGSAPIPVGNHTDQLVYEVFLQKVVFMSARNYERLLITKVFKTGNHRLTIAESTTELLETLRTNSRSVTFMWRDDAEKTPGLRVVQTIWEGNVE